MYPGITSRSLPCAYRTNEIRNANENSFSRGYVWEYPPVLVICIPYADNATHITVHSPVQRRPALLKNKPVRQGSSIQPFSGLSIEVIFFYEILDHRQQAEKIPPKRKPSEPLPFIFVFTRCSTDVLLLLVAQRVLLHQILRATGVRG